jgi:hypothetical protein
LKNETQRPHQRDIIGTIPKVPSDGVGVFNPYVAVSYAEIEGFALIEAGGGGGGGLVGGTAVFVGDGEGDIVVTVIGVGVSDVLSGDGVSAVTEVPGVGEIVAGAAVFGCG